MAVAKLAISLPPEVAAESRAAADELGITVSRWFCDAAQQHLALHRIGRMVKLFEAEYGPRTEEEVAAAHKELYRRD